MQSYSEANDFTAPSIDTVPEQNYDVVTQPGASNNVQIFKMP